MPSYQEPKGTKHKSGDVLGDSRQALAVGIQAPTVWVTTLDAERETPPAQLLTSMSSPSGTHGLGCSWTVPPAENISPGGTRWAGMGSQPPQPSLISPGLGTFTGTSESPNWDSPGGPSLKHRSLQLGEPVIPHFPVNSYSSKILAWSAPSSNTSAIQSPQFRPARGQWCLQLPQILQPPCEHPPCLGSLSIPDGTSSPESLPVPLSRRVQPLGVGAGGYQFLAAQHWSGLVSPTAVQSPWVAPSGSLGVIG